MIVYVSHINPLKESKPAFSAPRRGSPPAGEAKGMRKALFDRFSGHFNESYCAYIVDTNDFN
jgi:hypothetical protein